MKKLLRTVLRIIFDPLLRRLSYELEKCVKKTSNLAKKEKKKRRKALLSCQIKTHFFPALPKPEYRLVPIRRIDSS